MVPTFLKKLNIELRSRNSITRYLLKRTEKMFRSLFTAELFTIAKAEINPRSTNRISDSGRRSIHMAEYHAAINRNGILTCTTMWINLETSHQGKSGRHKKDRHCMIQVHEMSRISPFSKRQKADLGVSSRQGKGEGGVIAEGLQSSCLG